MGTPGVLWVASKASSIGLPAPYTARSGQALPLFEPTSVWFAVFAQQLLLDTPNLTGMHSIIRCVRVKLPPLTDAVLSLLERPLKVLETVNGFITKPEGEEGERGKESTQCLSPSNTQSELRLVLNLHNIN